MTTLQPPRARRVAVVGGVRIPFARSDGPYATASSQEMPTAALNGLAERHGLTGPGAVGARTPAYAVQQARGPGRGLISVCAAGGRGVTAVLEPERGANEAQMRRA